MVRYRGTEKNVSVPDTVRTIGQGAFENDTNIELVVVPNSVKRIEAYAFWGCENLDTVVLGKGLNEVGDYAFTNCTGLEQMTIPSTATSIGTEAFKDCINLKDVTIPPETVKIQESAFDGCYQLTIHYEEGSAAEEFAKAFYERQKEMPGYEEKPAPSSPPDAEQPDDPAPTSVPEETPSPTQTPVEEGFVLGSTQIVGNRAVLFMDNTKLQVSGGGSGRNEADGPQESGADGTEAVPPVQDGIDGEIGFLKYRIVDGKTVADQAYYRKTDLGDMTLEEGVSEIGEFSFARSSLTSLVLPQGMEKIGYGAFYHCGQLAEMELPDSVMCVEPKAFEHTLWVDSFLAGEEDGNAESGDFLITGGVLAAYRGDSKEVSVPEGVRVIAGEVFRDHEEIESVTLPESLLVVGEGAFEGCTNLGGITFGGSVEQIKDRAFLGNAMSEVSLPASVKKVGLQAFGNTVVAYQGEEAEYTYEASATRLSNESYRVYDGAQEGEAGVTVSGLEGAVASMNGAARSYYLTAEEPEDTSDVESAFLRVYQDGIPEDMVLYRLTLTDASGIPLVKLGSQALEVTIPVPEALQGKEVRMVTLDGNGQLERLDVERIMAEDVDSIRFRLNRVTMIGIYGAKDESAAE